MNIQTLVENQAGLMIRFKEVRQALEDDDNPFAKSIGALLKGRHVRFLSRM